MINGLEGIPRSGKSYEATVFHVLVYLQQGYQVITNLPLNVDMFAAINPDFRSLIVKRTRPQPIRGTWDANRIDEDGNGEAFELFSDGHTEEPDASVPVFGQVWDYYSTWKHPKTKLGPRFVIDECHVALPKMGTPAAVIQWYKLHGHFNADVLLLTQSFRDINQPIAQLMGMLVKVRKADILGRADHYIRKVHGGYRGAVISTEQRKYQPQYFQLYRSHTQGNAVAEASATDIKPLSVKLKRFTLSIWFIFAIGAAIVFWPKDKPQEKSADWIKALPPAPQTPVTYADPIDLEKASPAQIEAAAAPANEPPKSDAHPEPFKGKGVHLLGSIQLGQRQDFRFTISDGGKRMFDMTHAEISAAGYKFTHLTHCAGVLVFDGASRPVICDAPAQGSGSNSQPVVIEAGRGVPTSAEGVAALSQ